MKNSIKLFQILLTLMFLLGFIRVAVGLFTGLSSNPSFGMYN